MLNADMPKNRPSKPPQIATKFATVCVSERSRATIWIRLKNIFTLDGCMLQNEVKSSTKKCLKSNVLMGRNTRSSHGIYTEKCINYPKKCMHSSLAQACASLLSICIKAHQSKLCEFHVTSVSNCVT